MKKLGVLFLMIIFISCTKEEDKTEAMISGNYHLVDAQCFCLFEPDTDFSSYKLSFSEKDNSVTISNSLSESLNFIAIPGTYQYNIENGILKIVGNETSYNYSLQGSRLTLVKIDDPQIADDELTLIFEKD